MPSTTRGFPYPAAGDAPDGPAQMQALADAVQAELDGTVPVGALTATGAVTGANVTATATVQGADLTATDDLTVGDDATIAGDLAVTGTATVTGAASVGSLTVGGKLRDGPQVGAFSAYRNAALSLATGTAVVFDAEQFDVSSWYDTATGRYTPQVAGIYRVTAHIAFGSLSVADALLLVYLAKNGTQSIQLGQMPERASAACSAGGTTLIAMNGSTDYLTVVPVYGGTSPQAVSNGAAPVVTYFQGELAGRN